MGSRCPSLPGGCTVASGSLFQEVDVGPGKGGVALHRQDITLLPLF